MTTRSAAFAGRRHALRTVAALAACVVPVAAVRAAGVAAPEPVWLRGPDLPDVALRDQDDRPVRLQQDLVAAHTVIVEFMFAGCKSVCPPQTALLREALQRLAAQPRMQDVRAVSITVDPLADGPAQLRAFGERYALPMDRDRRWTLLTGRPADVARVLAAFGVPASVPGDHPAQLWLGDARRGRWTRTSSLNPPDTLVALVQALKS